MFENNNNGNTLHNHLIQDGFFNNGVDSLSIIDDYHTKGINLEAIYFFQEAFRNTGLRKITIYYQIKQIWPNTAYQINKLADESRINHNELSSFLVFILTSVNSKTGTLKENLTDIYRKGISDRTIQSSLHFIDAMSQVSIEVNYQPYNSLNFKPPFHGRYWINQNKGYIVDGSLDTYTKGKIFAQKMDEENFNIISSLMSNDIRRSTGSYDVLTGQRIKEIHNLLTRYLLRR